jgi:hypothetical protein
MESEMGRLRIKSRDPDGDRVARALMADSAIPKPCLLCGVTTHSRGVFCPNDSQKYGGNDSKQRLVIYPLCENESRDLETYDMIELILEAKISSEPLLMY